MRSSSPIPTADVPGGTTTLPAACGVAPSIRRLVRLALLAACVALGIHLAGTATAHAGVSSYNEPTYTKTATNNAFWYRWNAVTGTDENANTRYEWYLCFRTYHTYPNGSQVLEEDSSGTNGPGTTNCTASLRSGPSPTFADYGAMPYNGTSTVLADGHRYDLCASGFYRWPYLWKWDNSSACPWTIVDRNKPQISVGLAGGAAYATSAAVPVSIGYSDATSPPWAGAGGTASNWVCVGSAACTPGGSPNAACSTPADPSSRTTSFSCTMNVASDGRWYLCAIAADGAVPDNASGTDQFAYATSNNANLSATVCDDVVVDRAAPAVTVTASATSVAAGKQVTLAASARDATSGLTGAYEWDFGDGDSSSGGSSLGHVYSQPGTYVAKASVRDGAGNKGSGSVTVVVSGSGGGSGGGGSTPGGSSPGSGGGQTGGGGSVAAGGAVSVIAAPSAGAVGRVNGSGATQQLKAGGLRLVAPKSFLLAPTRRTLRLRAAIAGAGTVTLTLARGSKRVARGTVRAKRAGTFGVALRLPASLKAGRYALTAAFTAAGGATVKRTATIVVRRGASQARSLTGIPLAR